MIVGIVKNHEARVQLKVIGPRTSLRVRSVLDTGFTGDLTLPPSVIKRLKLPWDGYGRNILGDGSVSICDVFKATVLWDGRLERIFVEEAGTDPLIGMNLLSNFELKMQVCQAGKVTIRRLTR
jgi:clan AA aspartic protease